MLYGSAEAPRCDEDEAQELAELEGVGVADAGQSATGAQVARNNDGGAASSIQSSIVAEKHSTQKARHSTANPECTTRS